MSSTWAAISFAQSFSQPPRFVAGIATCDGSDSAHLRYDRTSLTKSRVQVTIEEDTTAENKLADLWPACYTIPTARPAGSPTR